MAPSFLASSGNASSAKHFEIRVNEQNLVLRGSPEEATGALLRGTLVLCLSEPLKVLDIHMRFTGEIQIQFPAMTGHRPGYNSVKHASEFLRKVWTPVNPSKGSEILQPGNYEFDFEHVLPGNTPESIEGLKDNWIVYRMKATINRGKLASNIHARKHIRVIRTFDASALELSHGMSVENVWPEKLNYSIAIPSKGVIFGTSVEVTFILIPLLEKLKIGKIDVDLTEGQVFSTENDSTVWTREYKIERKVVQAVWNIPDEEPQDVMGQDGWTFTRSLELPKSMRDYVQSVECKGIRVRHRLKFVVSLHNPDGHVSELRASLPLHIFISPNLPLDESNSLVPQTPQTVDASAGEARHAPPLYGEHQYDQLYSDVDPRGYVTPSIPNSPLAQSPRGSADNLASLGDANDGDFAANALTNRLSNLQIPDSRRYGRHGASGSNTSNGSNEATTAAGTNDISVHGDNFTPVTGGGDRTSHGTPVSRRVSNEAGSSSGVQTPQHIELRSRCAELSPEELSKVPSYGTALHTPSRTPVGDGLPDYVSATSRPPSSNGVRNNQGQNSQLRSARSSPESLDTIRPTNDQRSR